jgi:hypothetical protein
VLFERVKPLLLAIARLEKVEAKTDKPENYARLGVQEPAANADNMRIALFAAGDEPVASLIIGKIRGGLIAGGRDGIYVRASGNAREWLVAGRLDLPQRRVDWVDRQIVHIKPKAVKQVSIRHPDSSRLVIEKAFRGAPGFRIVNQPGTVGVKKASQVNALARSLAGLKMEDMRSRPPDDLTDREVVTAEFETWEGLRVIVRTREQDGRVWAWFDLAGSTETAADGVQERFAGWIYQLPLSRATRLRARLIDLKDADQ